MRRSRGSSRLCGALLLSLGACARSTGNAQTPDPEPNPVRVATSPDASETSALVRSWKGVDTDPQPGIGRDFASDIALLHRVVACGGDDPIPPSLDADVVDRHCAQMLPVLQAYRDNYLAKAAPFFAEIRPKDLPPAVVYPFGGGDLLSALTTFPDALEYTTISLEYAGDPRRLANIGEKERLEEGLNLISMTMGTLLKGDWNWTRNMEQTQKGELPGQIASALAAMVVHGYAPLSLRFFRLERDGSVTYLTDADIEALEGKRPDAMQPWREAPDWSEAFSNMEIRFRKPGGGPTKVFRHIAANIADKYITSDPEHLTRDPSLLAHLTRKGPVAAMTRAASHLLWEDYFSEIRNYLTNHLVWMPSDATGVPPPFAEAAGLVQETWGRFAGAYDPSDQKPRDRYNEAFSQLFAKSPERPLAFRYGYPDVNRDAHLIVTRRP